MDEKKAFEEARWKLADDLTDRDIELLVKHKGELNQEEQDAFRDVLSASVAPFPDDPNQVLDDTIKEAVDHEAENAPPPDANQPPANTQPATPPAPATPAAAPSNIPQTQEQLDAYLEHKRRQWDTEGKTQAEQDAKEKEIQTFFDAGYKPQDWNEAANQMFQKFAPLFEQRVIARLEAQNKKNLETLDERKKSQEVVMQGFEKEFDTLSENGLIPKRDDAQYEAVRKQIWDIGDNNGKTNITDAYKLWSIIPVTHGGGLVVEGGETPPPADPNAQIDRQKQAAGRIKSGAGAGGGSKKGGPPVWANIHSTSMDDLLERAKATHGLPV